MYTSAATRSSVPAPVITLPPYEWPTRTTGPLTLPIVAFATATSSAVELSPCCDEAHSYPSASRGPISLLKHEPSAQSPWQKTILGLDCISVSPLEGLFVGLDAAGGPEGDRNLAGSKALFCASP